MNFGDATLSAKMKKCTVKLAGWQRKGRIHPGFLWFPNNYCSKARSNLQRLPRLQQYDTVRYGGEVLRVEDGLMNRHGFPSLAVACLESSTTFVRGILHEDVECNLQHERLCEAGGMEGLCRFAKYISKFATFHCPRATTATATGTLRPADRFLSRVTKWTLIWGKHWQSSRRPNCSIKYTVNVCVLLSTTCSWTYLLYL